MLDNLKRWLDSQRKTSEAKKLARKTARRYKKRTIGILRPSTKPSLRPVIRPVIRPVTNSGVAKPTGTKPVGVISVVDSLLAKQHIREGSKNAVLIGLNYTGTASALKGCINDALRMKETLEKKYNYINTKIYTDKDLTLENNILQVLEQLVTSGVDTLFFQYSGHGTQVRDDNGDEEDGKDEALYSVNNTIIRDDDILVQVKKVRKGVLLVLVFDACHSGTMVDLPYQLIGQEIKKINNNTLEGDIISISGCKDTQTSADVSSGFTSYGAMSNALQKVISEMSPSTTWRTLADKLNVELRTDRQSQIPQLCVSKPELVDQVVSL